VKCYSYADGTFEAVYEIKRSKFIATVSGEVDAETAEDFVKSVKKKYADATHNCYAYISDIGGQATRFSDDGEPGGTAGQPILQVLRKKGLVRTAVVVTRYFGGIKLGAGGLVGAYTESAVLGLESAKISTKTKCVQIAISIDYPLYSSVEKLIWRNNWILDGTEFLDGVCVKIWVKEDDVDGALALIKETTLGRANCIVSEEAKFIKA
jgi:uncharacterized YigZ family protein